MFDIKEIAYKIKNAGGNLYLVGGAVRDELLGRLNHDEDYCVTGLSFDEFKTIFPNSFVRGNAFSVFDIEGREFALARIERKIGEGHKEFDIKTDKKFTIDDDLARRDITINAIAKEVLSDRIIDPFGGIQDINNKTIRAVTEHFKEDPLRVYRVARFSSELEFEVEARTLGMMKSLKNELHTISVERVYVEFSKALLSNKPSIFFNVLKKADVLSIHFNEFQKLIGAEQPIKYHPEGDSYNHTMIVLDEVAESTKDYDKYRKLEIRFGALVHDIGKGETPKEEYPHHYMHEERGEKIVSVFGNRLKIPTRLIKCGKTACIEHMRGGIFAKMKPSKKVEFIERVDKSILGLDGLQIIVNADNKNCMNFEEIGRKCIDEIDGDYIKDKYGNIDGLEVKNRLHEERIKWIKQYVKL